jgi:hypothetical protein
MDDREHRARWAPVVYGRTRRVDRWWRAVPEDVAGAWLEPQVMGVVAGGRRLVEGPRFLLAQGSTHLLVGTACQARLLSDTMHSDGTRELYCFVGWVAPRDEAVRAPELERLREEFQAWAVPVYAEWMAHDWNLPPRNLQAPRPTPPEPARWTTPAEPKPVVDQWYVGHSHVWPIDAARMIWEGVRAAPHPATVSVGWTAAADGLTDHTDGPLHIVATDVAHYAELPPRPPRPAPSPPPAQPPRRQQPPPPDVKRRQPHESKKSLARWFKDALLPSDPHHELPAHHESAHHRHDPESHDRHYGRYTDEGRVGHGEALDHHGGEAQPRESRPAYRPPIVPLINNAQRAAKVDADFAFGPSTPVEPSRRDEPDRPARPLDPAPPGEPPKPAPLGPIAVGPVPAPLDPPQSGPTQNEAVPVGEPPHSAGDNQMPAAAKATHDPTAPGAPAPRPGEPPDRASDPPASGDTETPAAPDRELSQQPEPVLDPEAADGDTAGTGEAGTTRNSGEAPRAGR